MAAFHSHYRNTKIKLTSFKLNEIRSDIKLVTDQLRMSAKGYKDRSTIPEIFNAPEIEAAVQRCSVKKVFFELLQNSQENTCARVSFLITLQVLGLQLY